MPGCEIKYRSDPLPERLLAEQHLKTAWFPFPYGEAGIDYDFIGLGWIATFENCPRMTLKANGGDVASVGSPMTRWEPTFWGRRLFQDEGWSVSDSNVCGILIGCADREDEHLPMEIHRKRESYGERPWEIDLKPAMVLGDTYDRAVFVLHVYMYYQRLVGFDSRQYRFVKSTMGPMDHNCVHSFQLEFQDLATGRKIVINGKYPTGPARAELTLEQAPGGPPATSPR